MRWTIGSDIDGTLTGDAVALQRLAGRIAAFRAAGGKFALVTGRSYGEVLCGLVDEGLPMADAIITQVGTEIYLPPFVPDQSPLAAWSTQLQQAFTHQRAVDFVEPDGQWVLQSGKANTALKASWWYVGRGDPDAAAQRVAARVAEHPDYRMIWSSGRDLDILPATAGKGCALRFLVEYWQRDADACVVAGDTGNDINMIEAFSRGIVVANAQAELLRFGRERNGDTVFMASHPYAAGVEQGLDYWSVLP